MIKYKLDIMQALKEAGYNPQRLRNEKLIGQKTLTDIRRGNNGSINVVTLSKLCALLNCQPGDLLEYVPDPDDLPDGVAADSSVE